MLHRLNKLSDAEAASELREMGAALERECRRLDRLFDRLTPGIQARVEAIIPGQFDAAVARKLLALADAIEAEIEREDAA